MVNVYGPIVAIQVLGVLQHLVSVSDVGKDLLIAIYYIERSPPFQGSTLTDKRFQGW